MNRAERRNRRVQKIKQREAKKIRDRNSYNGTTN